MSAKDDSIIIDYFKLTKKYQARYGPSTLVLLQVGAFFEVYSIKCPLHGTYEITPIQIFADVCNLNIAEKKIVLGHGQTSDPIRPFPVFQEDATDAAMSRQISQWLRQMPPCSVVMAGVRDHQLDRYVQKMVDEGFTVVIYVQEKSGKEITRVLHEIHSPGTLLGYENDTTTTITNHITCIWLDKIPINKAIRSTKTSPTAQATRDLLVCGMASFNICTGESFLFEYQTPLFMNPTTFDELERHLTTMLPNEIVLVSELSPEELTPMLNYLGMNGRVPIHVTYTTKTVGADANQSKAMNCTKQTYINHILSSLFQEDTFSSCIEFQSNIVATQAFCFLVNFVQEHNSDLVQKIQLPTFTNTSSRMMLANHTLRQLNILSDPSHDVKHNSHLSSVSTLLNQCGTPMGKRLFQHQLTHPIFDETSLNRQYDTIDRVLTNIPITELSDIRRRLRTMRDIEKIGRQIISKRIYPSSIVQLHTTLREWHDMMMMSEVMVAMDHQEECGHEKVKQFLEFLEHVFVLEHCQGTRSMKEFEQCIFQSEIFPELSDCLEQQTNTHRALETMQKELNDAMVQGSQGSMKDDCIKWHKTDKGGMSLHITKKRGTLLKELIHRRNDTLVFTNIPKTTTTWNDIQVVKATASYDEIVFPQLKQMTQSLMRVEEQLNEIMSATYINVLNTIGAQWYSVIECAAKNIAVWDVFVTKAHIAREYHYCRPVIAATTEEDSTSWVQARGLRHALIEHIQTNELYVTNDVDMGCNEQQGILLYGTNAVGKTSLIRALGIAVIMAQSGGYVPCKEFRYRPYRSIFSRILGNDNLFKGLSTFAVEMSELRLILNMADGHSLVLGDELCSGTEVESALAIFMSGLMHLYKRGSSFIFATHFHEMLKFEELHVLSHVHVKHMSVVYDPIHDSLVYDRKLKDGPGNGTYGIEVAKSMHMDPDFLEQAYQLRHRYFSNKASDLTLKPSHYNARKLYGMCELCKEHMGDEIHHIQYQQHADKVDGYMADGSFHKNNLANLMSICRKCHDAQHRNDRKEKEEEKPKMIRTKTTKGYILREESL